MKQLAIVAGALGTFLLVAGAARAQAPSPPVTQPLVTAGPSFVDANGDGVCDNCTGTPKGKGRKARQGKGRDGTGNQGVGPRDGSGTGSGQGSGRGACNGTGPRGRRQSGR